MQSAVPVGEGSMAAIIGLDDDTINAICADISTEQGVVAAVNFNSPGQVVIAGHTAAVEAAVDALKAAGAKRAMPLPVSAPFHTSLMQTAGERLAEAIAEMEIASPQDQVKHLADLFKLFQHKRHLRPDHSRGAQCACADGVGSGKHPSPAGGTDLLTRAMDSVRRQNGRSGRGQSG